MPETTVDQQQTWDEETLKEFRTRVHVLTAKVRHLLREEADLKDLARKAKKARKRSSAALWQHVEADSGSETAAAFAGTCRTLNDAATAAADAEREARQLYVAAVGRRQEAEAKLRRCVETYLAPVPLFDRRPEPQSQPEGKQPRRRRR